jgi:glutamate synthase domain-containing protein 3
MGMLPAMKSEEPDIRLSSVTLSADGVYYRELNERLREAIRSGADEVIIKDVMGQRYIGTGIHVPGARIRVHGVPGEDMAAFMDGPEIIVHGNAQDGVGNTMNEGRIEVHGSACDVVGYGMRGGRIYVRDDVGYRVGIHMKGFRDKQPLIVVGGCAGNFFGEYMAGGCQVLLGMGQTDEKKVDGIADGPAQVGRIADGPAQVGRIADGPAQVGRIADGPAQVVGDYCATGMHGGKIFIRGEVADYQLGAEVRRFDLTEDDREFLMPIIDDFATTFGIEEKLDDFDRFVKILPVSARPYGRLYVY